jgi:hypothetical protein
VYDLDTFGLKEMTLCGAALRQSGVAAKSMEDTAGQMVKHLYAHLRHDGKPGCALVRLYKTHPFGALGEDERRFAANLMKDQALTDQTRCLTLLATAGEHPTWNARATSNGHRAIPLPSEQVIAKIPMIAQLVHQLGLDASAVVRPNSGIIIDKDERTFNVFYVPDANGSPYIPAQDFVSTYGVRSVLGFGGMLPDGNLFSLILFTKAFVPQESAEHFRTVALSAKLALIPFADRVFS